MNILAAPCARPASPAAFWRSAVRFFLLMSHESDRRPPAAERSFDPAEDELRLVEDVLSYIRASKENGSGRSAETLQVRLLWQILKALDGEAFALAEGIDRHSFVFHRSATTFLASGFRLPLSGVPSGMEYSEHEVFVAHFLADPICRSAHRSTCAPSCWRHIEK